MASPAYEAVAEHIRNLIVGGEFHPGQKVPQDEIGARLGVSRTPIREALRQLDVEGFVRVLPSRGAIVRELSVEDIHEVYQIRIELEGLAARLAAPRATPDQIERLRGLLGDMRQAIERNDIPILLGLSNAFHDTCYASCGNDRLVRIITDLRNYSLRYRVFYAHIPESIHGSLLEHEAVANAFEMRDADLAERTMEHDMERTADVLIGYMTRQRETAGAFGFLSASVPGLPVRPNSTPRG